MASYTCEMNIDAWGLPEKTEINRMIEWEQYRELFYLRTNVFYQLARKEQESKTMNEQDKKQEQIRALQEQDEPIDWAVVVLCW